MFERVLATVPVLREEVTALEPGCLTGDDAEKLLDAFTTIERLASAGRLKLARRIEQSNIWRRQGHKSAAQYLSRQSGESLGKALAMLETAEQLESLPATAEAFNNGELSVAQTKEIASAATANPAAEQRLLAGGGKQPLSWLQRAGREAKSAAANQAEDQARYRAIHDSRHLRRWVDPDGAVCGQYRLAPDVGAAFNSEIDAMINSVFDQARREGRREAPEAYAADALIALARAGAGAATGSDYFNGGGSPAPKTTVHVRVDHSVLTRGWVEDGETCDVAGVGPIPAATARSLAEDAILKVLVTDGTDIKAVAHAGRNIPARLRSALEERDRCCCRPGCTATKGLEIHHLTPFSQGTPASLATCARVCHWDHYLITYCGYELKGTPENWVWVSPSAAAQPGAQADDRRAS